MPSLAKGWVAGFGYAAGKVPGWVYLFWIPVMVCAFLIETKKLYPAKWIRVFLFAMSLFASLSIYTIVFIPTHAIGGLTALVKHGRYFVPFAPLAFVALSGMISLADKWHSLAAKIVVFFFVLAQGFYTLGVYTTYYTYCNYNAYAGEKCSLPIYKNLEKENINAIPLTDGVKITQEFTKACGDLEAVEIYITRKPNDMQGELNFSLLSNTDKLLFSDAVSVEAITERDYLRIPLDTLAATQQDIYKIQLSSTGILAEGLGVAITPQDYYPGTLSQNGTEKTQDLLIHYVCTTP